MNIGFVSTRFAGTDGVSLETTKMAEVARRLGHQTFFCAGELDAGLRGVQARGLHFEDPVAQLLYRLAFVDRESAHSTGSEQAESLIPSILARANQLRPPLERFIHDYAIDFLIVQNAFAIPMQLPLAHTLATLIDDTGVPALAHNHDFYWERMRFDDNHIGTYLDSVFPPEIEHLQHAVINSLAQESLRERRGLESVLIPNVFDFDTPAPGIDDYNRDFRQAIDMADDDWLILQPTRVIPRKGIEHAIELVARLNDPRAKLVITHNAGDEGMGYLQELMPLAASKGVDLRYVADIIGDNRGMRDGRKVYSLWDAYPHADFVTYPSLVEGFGNALIETIYFRKPALVNRYPVYSADIAPKGFSFIEMDGVLTNKAVEAVRELLEHPDRAQPIVEKNYALGLEHYSYAALETILNQIFESI